MSAASVGPRDGDWSLLGYDSDPVPATEEGLDDVVAHYKKIAEAMSTQAALLKKIGDGDETLLKGKSADAMRKRSRENADLLDRAAGRYESVRDALVDYQPELGTARSKTGEALREAEDAAAKRNTAEDTPDPVNEDRDDDAPDLTDKDRKQSQKRAAAISGANDALEAAKAKAVAREALDTAAQTAANTIRRNWDTDDLHSSNWDKFLYGLNQFLKKLVEVLGYIGLALTALAILIPGLGFLALAGLVVTAVATLATFFLAVQGEASWLGVIIGVLSLGLAGVGAIAAKALKGLQAIKLTGGGWLKSAVGKVDGLKNLKNWHMTNGGKFQIPRKPVPGTTGVGVKNLFDRKIAQALVPVNGWKNFAGSIKINPNWWNPFSKAYWKADWSTLKAFVPNLLKGKWDWRAALGPMDEIAAVNNINTALKNILGAAPSGMGAWKYIGNIVGVSQPIFNMATYIFSVTVAPSNFNPDDPRFGWSKWLEAEFSDLYTRQLNL